MELESPYPSKAHQPQEQRYPFLPVTEVCRCVQTMVYGCQCLGFLTCAQMLIDAIARGGCPDTVGEFALKLTGRTFLASQGTPTSVYLKHPVVERLQLSWKAPFLLRQTE